MIDSLLQERVCIEKTGMFACHSSSFHSESCTSKHVSMVPRCRPLSQHLDEIVVPVATAGNPCRPNSITVYDPNNFEGLEH